MTEAEWLASTDPRKILAFLHGEASKRKLRLFAVACARDLLEYNPASHPDERWGGRKAFESAILRAEAFADGQGPPLPSYDMITTIWVAHPNAALAAQVVFGVDPGCEVLIRDPDDAIQDFRTKPAHWFRDIFGPPPLRCVSAQRSWLAGNGGTVLKIAQAIYEDRTFDRLPILADALEEAGCDNADILDHCRGPGPHVRGCWVVDLLLGKV
jgi:hypothetical protein